MWAINELGEPMKYDDSKNKWIKIKGFGLGERITAYSGDYIAIVEKGGQNIVTNIPT